MIEIEHIARQYQSYKELCTQLFAAYKSCAELNAECKSFEIIDKQIVENGKFSRSTDDVAARLDKLCETYRMMLAVPVLERYREILKNISKIRTPAIFENLIHQVDESKLYTNEKLLWTEYKQLTQEALEVETVLINMGFSSQWLVTNGYCLCSRNTNTQREGESLEEYYTRMMAEEITIDDAIKKYVSLPNNDALLNINIVALHRVLWNKYMDIDTGSLLTLIRNEKYKLKM